MNYYVSKGSSGIKASIIDNIILLRFWRKKLWRRKTGEIIFVPCPIFVYEFGLRINLPCTANLLSLSPQPDISVAEKYDFYRNWFLSINPRHQRAKTRSRSWLSVAIYLQLNYCTILSKSCLAYAKRQCDQTHLSAQMMAKCDSKWLIQRLILPSRNGAQRCFNRQSLH